MKVNISLIVSVLAIIVAGFTMFRNPQQQVFGATVPAFDVKELQKVDTIKKELANDIPYNVYRVLYTANVPFVISQKGLPTYDSVMIPQPFVRNVLQQGRFNEKLFIDNTFNAVTVVAFDKIR